MAPGKQNYVKKESPAETTPMEGIEEAANGSNQQSESPSSHADGASSEQSDGKSSEQSDGKSSEQSDGKSSEQSDGKSSEQSDGKSSEQSDGKPSEQSDGKPSEQSGGTSSTINPFQLDGVGKRVLKIPGDEDARRDYRSFSPAAAEPLAKRNKSENQNNIFGQATHFNKGLFGSNPSPRRARSFFPTPQEHQRTQPSTPSHNNHESYVKYKNEIEELRGDLVGGQSPPENMKTQALVVGGDSPIYLNKYSIGDKDIYRIESIKSDDFVERGAKVLSNETDRASQSPTRWGQVADVLGVAALGDENEHSDFLSRLDPENMYNFDWNQSVFIVIKRTDGETAYVSRGWWRLKYRPKNLSARKAYRNKQPGGYYYRYMANGDTVLSERKNRNAFQDYRLFKWAFWFERQYYQAQHPGKGFAVGGRAKSPSPIDDDIFRFRESTILRDVEDQSPNIVQSVESPLAESVVEVSTPRRNTRRSQQPSARQPGTHQPSARQPRTHQSSEQRVNPQGSPRPRNSRLFDRMRQPLFTPRPTAMAH